MLKGHPKLFHRETFNDRKCRLKEMIRKVKGSYSFIRFNIKVIACLLQEIQSFIKF